MIRCTYVTQIELCNYLPKQIILQKLIQIVSNRHDSSILDYPNTETRVSNLDTRWRDLNLLSTKWLEICGSQLEHQNRHTPSHMNSSI